MKGQVKLDCHIFKYLKTAFDFHLPLFFTVSTDNPNFLRSIVLPMHKLCFEYSVTSNPDLNEKFAQCISHHDVRYPETHQTA